jgi:hypothetical protein
MKPPRYRRYVLRPFDRLSAKPRENLAVDVPPGQNLATVAVKAWLVPSEAIDQS